MPSSKAMENKTLTAACANPGCGKRQSTELMVGITVGAMGRRRQIAVCAACAESGWRPADEAEVPHFRAGR
jgi:hypothetical protein